LAGFKNDPRVLEALVKALHDSHEDVRISAKSALGYLGDKRAIAPLKLMLKNASRRSRRIVNTHVFTDSSGRFIGLSRKADRPAVLRLVADGGSHREPVLTGFCGGLSQSIRLKPAGEGR